MKKTQFTEEQMVKIVREADKAPVKEVAKARTERGHDLHLAQALWRA